MTNSVTDLKDLTLPQPVWFQRAFEVPRQSAQVEVDGTPIHYLLWGDPTRPGIVLTHGFMAHARCWAFIAPLLAEDYCLAALDLSGMGDSGWRSAYGISERAEEVYAVAEHAGFTNNSVKPALVCHSYGGSVGLSAAESQPEAWSKLIACDMNMQAPGEPSQFEERIQQRAVREVRPHKVYPSFADASARFRLTPDQPCDNDFLMEYMARHSLKQVEGGWQWKFDPRILGPDDQRDPQWWQTTASRFCALPIPKAVVHGEHSIMLSQGGAEYVREHSDAPLVEIPDAYHHIMLDQPLALVAALAALLQSLK